MELRKKINTDIKMAMLEGDTFKRDTLKFIKAEIMTVEKNEGKELSDEEIIKIFRKTIKNMETIDREKEKQEIALLSEYLPKPLTEEEIKKLVRDATLDFPERYAEYKQGNKGLIGLFIGETMKRSKGSGDSKMIGKIVKEILDS